MKMKKGINFFSGFFRIQREIMRACMAGFSHDEVSRFCKAAFTEKVREIERAYPKIKVQEEPRTKYDKLHSPTH